MKRQIRAKSEEKRREFNKRLIEKANILIFEHGISS